MAIRKRFWLLPGILILLCGFLFYGYYQYQRTNQDLKLATPDQTLTVSTLIHEFAGDDTLADKIYRKRILAVRGTVRSVDTTNNGVSVILGDSLQNASIRFSMDEAWNEISAIQAGMTVTIKGMLNGYSKDQTGLLGDEIVFNRGIWIRNP